MNDKRLAYVCERSIERRLLKVDGEFSATLPKVHEYLGDWIAEPYKSHAATVISRSIAQGIPYALCYESHERKTWWLDHGWPQGDTFKGVIQVAGENAIDDERLNPEDIFGQGVLDLAKTNWLSMSNLGECIAHITETAAQMVAVERASVWFYDETRSHIECSDLFLASQSIHQKPGILKAKDFPEYFEAMRQARIIDAVDAHKDARTAEFSGSYLLQHHIGAMLDAPIRFRGETCGVICLEHVGDTRDWTRNEKAFISTLTDVLALAMEQWQHQHSLQEHARLELKMLESQKLESLGVLAGGIAHDLNNMLTPILSRASLAALKLGSNHPAIGDVVAIEQAAIRAGDIIKQLLAYAGRTPNQKRPVNINRVVREMTELLKHTISSHAEIKYELSRHKLVALADPGQIQQVVLNLITNASDAVASKRGTILLRTKLIDQGRSISLEVIDNGCGMDQKTQASIFDPFFTTKADGHGLGLAAVMGIVEGHGGSLHVTSEPNVGTEIRLVLPLVTESEQIEVKDSHGVIVDSEKGTILIIDDDALIRECALVSLEYFGYQALEAESGSKGLQLFNEHLDEILCVIVDQSMPDMDGPDVIKSLRLISPNIPILGISGHARFPLPKEIDLTYTRFLQKPFKPQEIIERVETLVARAKVDQAGTNQNKQEPLA